MLEDERERIVLILDKLLGLLTVLFSFYLLLLLSFIADDLTSNSTIDIKSKCQHIYYNVKGVLFLKNNIHIYILSTIVLTLGGIVYNFAISYFILQETGSALYFSINTAIMSIGAILSLPISGVLVDSLDRKKMIIFLQSLSALTLLGLVLYIWLFGFNVFILFAITALRSLIIPVASNALDSSLTQLFDREGIHKVLSKIATYETSIFLLGPILAGVLYGFLTLEAMIFLFLVMQLVSLFANIFLKFEQPQAHFNVPDETTRLDSWLKNFIYKLTVGFRYIRESKTLTNVLILSIIINAVGAASFSVLPETIMIKELKFEPSQVGMVSGIIGLGSLLGSVALSKMKLENPLKVVRNAFLVIAILLLSFTMPVYLDFQIYMSMAALALIGMAMAFVFQFISIPLAAFMQKTVADEYKGRVFSTNGTLGMVFLPLGTILFGFLYNQGIYFSVNLFSAVVIIITVFVTLNAAVLKKSKEEYTSLNNQ